MNYYHLINITPMAVHGDINGNAKGALTLPASVSKGLRSRGYPLDNSLQGLFIYAGQSSAITITPKHKEKTNPALQFTVNDAIQFKQLKLDGADALVAGVLGVNGRRTNPALVCRIMVLKLGAYYQGYQVAIEVIGVRQANEDRAVKLMRKLTKSNKSFSAIADDDIICFESLSPWYDIHSDLGCYKLVTQCIYILWGTDPRNFIKKKLYIGIVGDEKGGAQSKRSLTQRLNEHVKNRTDMVIEKFRFFELKDITYGNVPEFLKTLEMRLIQTLSVLIPQAGNADILPIISDGHVMIDGTLCTIELTNLTYKHHG